MLKWIIYIILIGVIVGLAIGGFHLYRVSAKNKKEMSKFEGQKVEVTKDLGKVLVVYYSLSGNTHDVAEKIRDKTEGDIYEIKTLEELPKGMKLHMMVKNQLKSDQFPVLKQDMPNFSDYDTIFVGGPVWWYTAATPLLSFLTQVDFAGKRVVPFSTQGSNVGTFLQDFTSTARNAKILNYESFNNLPHKYDAAVDNKISEWINGLDV